MTGGVEPIDHAVVVLGRSFEVGVDARGRLWLCEWTLDRFYDENHHYPRVFIPIFGPYDAGSPAAVSAGTEPYYRALASVSAALRGAAA